MNPTTHGARARTALETPTAALVPGTPTIGAARPSGVPSPPKGIVTLLVVLAGFMLAPAAPAHAQVSCAFPVTVHGAAALDAAIDCFSRQPAGDYRITLGADIALTASTPVIQNGAGARLVIDGAGHTVDAQSVPGVRPFHVDAPMVTMRSITVAGGNVTDGIGGGGILKTGGKLVIDRSTIRDNVHHAQSNGQFAPGGGGGILNRAGTLVVRETTIADNSARDGDFEGGGGILNYGTLLVERSTFSGNRLVAGLAGSGPEGTGPINAGGAIMNGLDVSVGQPHTPATWVIPIRLKVVNSTFVDNSSNTSGGAIANRGLHFLIAGESGWFATAAVYNSTFSGNSAGSAGGGAIFNRRSDSGTFHSLIWVTNSIITDSPSGGDCVGCELGTGNLIGGDTMLGGLQDNGGRTLTRGPLDGSPAVDAGDIAETMFGAELACFTVNQGPTFVSHTPTRHGEGGCDHPDLVTQEVVTDQRGDGFHRFAGEAVDAGAVERQVPCPTFPASVGTASALGSALTCYNASRERGEHVIRLTGNIALTTSTFPVTNTRPGVSLRIDGDGHAVDGQRIAGVRVFAFADDTVAAIENLTIRGGALPPDSSCSNRRLRWPAVCSGGGIWNAGRLTVTDSTVTGNHAQSGGGIFNAGFLGFFGGEPTGASLTVERSAVSDNFSLGFRPHGGGGIFNDGSLRVTDSTIADNGTAAPLVTHILGGGILNLGGTMVVERSTFRGNIADQEHGGAIYNAGEGTVTRSVFSENLAVHTGGAIFNNGVLRVFDSTFTGNVAFGLSFADGGAISNLRSLLLVGSTLSGNSARGHGGGIDNEGTLTVINSTLSANTAGSDGGGISSTGTFTLANTIIAGSTAGGDCVGSASGGGHNLIGDTALACGLTDGVGGNLVGADPRLGPLQDNGGPTPTHAPSPTSPAIDAGDNGLAVDAAGEPLETDQRGDGFARVSGGTVDIGAVEAQRPQSTCLAGKTTCASKQAAALLQCERKAETPGKPADPTAGGCVDKASARFDGCFEKLENRTPNDCVTLDDTASVEALAAACVALVVEAIDPAPIDQSMCGAGKTKCAAKRLESILKCHQKAATPRKSDDPNFRGCIDKAHARFDGGSDPAKGCFEKLESKPGNDCLPPLDNMEQVGTTIDRCASELVAALHTAPAGALP